MIILKLPLNIKTIYAINLKISSNISRIFRNNHHKHFNLKRFNVVCLKTNYVVIYKVEFLNW
jgi:hypothetical protein